MDLRITSKSQNLCSKLTAFHTCDCLFHQIPQPQLKLLETVKMASFLLEPQYSLLYAAPYFLHYLKIRNWNTVLVAECPYSLRYLFDLLILNFYRSSEIPWWCYYSCHLSVVIVHHCLVIRLSDHLHECHLVLLWPSHLSSCFDWTQNSQDFSCFHSTCWCKVDSWSSIRHRFSQVSFSAWSRVTRCSGLSAPSLTRLPSPVTLLLRHLALSSQ